MFGRVITFSDYFDKLSSAKEARDRIAARFPESAFDWTDEQFSEWEPFNDTYHAIDLTYPTLNCRGTVVYENHSSAFAQVEVRLHPTPKHAQAPDLVLIDVWKRNGWLSYRKIVKLHLGDFVEIYVVGDYPIRATWLPRGQSVKD